MSETTAPYGSGATGGGGDAKPVRRVRTHHLREMKERGEKWAMLTAYDMYTAATFDEAGIPVLLVGDSASNNVYGNETSLPVTVDELIPLVRAVTRSARRALVVADLPFGSYQGSPEQAFHTAVRFMKEANAHAVKLEGGAEMAPQVELLTRSGIPVMAHIGFTPQSEHNLGGYRVQGRGETGRRLLADAQAMEAAGAFSVVMEMVPGDVAAEITKTLSIPTIGIGAGVDCDAQVLVWQDMAGLRTGRMPRFVKQYADLHAVLLGAAQEYAADVAAGTFPGPEPTVCPASAERQQQREPEHRGDGRQQHDGARTPSEPTAGEHEDRQPEQRHHDAVQHARERDRDVRIEESDDDNASDADERTGSTKIVTCHGTSPAGRRRGRVSPCAQGDPRTPDACRISDAAPTCNRDTHTDFVDLIHFTPQCCQDHRRGDRFGRHAS